jgi:DNA ligase-1
MSTIPTYPILYKINSNNKISEWEIKIIKKGAIYAIITTHGEKDGKKVTHEKDVEEGKGKKTILEQASQEALRKWKNKTEKELYSQTLPNLDAIIDATSITIRPMLAQIFSFDKYEKPSRAFKISFPAYVQRKYDGIRCLSYMKDGNIIIESRTGIPFQNFNKLKDELKELFKKLPPNFYLDGELYTDKIEFQVISGLIHLHEDKVSKEDLVQIDKVDYYVYDFIDTNNPDLTFDERKNFLNSFLKDNLKKDSRVISVPSFIVNKLDDITKYHEEFVSDGFEGTMVRDMKGPYEYGKRSKYLQKYKDTFDDEFKIIGYDQGVGDEKGAVIWKCITKDKKEFSSRPRGSFELRRELFLKADSYIGKWLTVLYKGYTPDGKLREPRGKAIRDNY